MATGTLEERVVALEADVARLKVKVEGGGQGSQDWLDWTV